MNSNSRKNPQVNNIQVALSVNVWPDVPSKRTGGLNEEHVIRLQGRLFTQEWCERWSRQSSQGWFAMRSQPRASATVTRCEVSGRSQVWKRLAWSGATLRKSSRQKVRPSESYLVIIPPLLWLNDKRPHMRYGHLDRALAWGLLPLNHVRGRRAGNAYLDLRLGGGGRRERLQRELDRWNRNW